MQNGQSRKSKVSDLFTRASRQWASGELKSAFRLFISAAKAGDRGAQVNVGFFYDGGIGVQKNRSKALSWYKRAYRRGDAVAANNIGTIWRDEKNSKRALYWFQQAASLGNDGSNLEIAKHYLQIERDPDKARAYLRKVCASDCVSEMEYREAKRLLRKLG